jgi:cell wall-associated NlpC family hydrolase
MMDDHGMPIPIGSRLPDFDGIKFVFANHTYRYSGQAVFPENLEPSAEKVLKIARRYLMSPYQWGGRSPLGIDAPGLTQMVFKLIGVNLLRTAEQQVYQGELIDFNEQAQAGDLAFFENKAGNISHVGIILPNQKIIHAAEQVRIDRLDHYGIFSENQNKYTHRLRVIKRHLQPQKLDLDMNTQEKTSEAQGALF